MLAEARKLQRISPKGAAVFARYVKAQRRTRFTIPPDATMVVVERIVEDIEDI